MHTPLRDRERTYRTEGIIMRRQDLGEADRILTTYTRDFGKLRLLGKGIRKPQSKTAGHVELFARVDLQLTRGRTFDIITQAQMLDAYLPLRQNLTLSTYASHFVELVDAFAEDEDENKELYDLLASGLAWLSETSDVNRTASYYELRLLDQSGYRPELFNCVLGGEKIKPENQFYSPEEGGVICPSKGRNTPRTYAITLDALKVMRYMQSNAFEVIEQVKIRPKVLGEVEYLLHRTLTFHLERRLKSVEFLNRLRQEEKKRQYETPNQSDISG